MTSDTSIQQTPFVKQLAANDRPTRDKAVESLKAYLSHSRTFTQSDFLKLWKGLFYCMWLSDRPRTQQRLADELASLVDVIRANNIFTYLEAFWMTMAREWTSIDVLRMDKFMLLVRRYLGASLRYLHKNGWDEKDVEKHNEVLESIPLHPTNAKMPNGLRYHMLDIYVDELMKVVKVENEAEDDDEETEEEFEITPEQTELLLHPFRRLEKESPTKEIKSSAKELLRDERIQKLLKASSG